jgi:hypothetical protein
MEWHDVATTRQLHVNTKGADTKNTGSELVDSGLGNADTGLRTRIWAQDSAGCVKVRIALSTPGGQVDQTEWVPLFGLCPARLYCT